MIASPPVALRVVGIAELVVSADPSECLITYALGSCLGVSVWDPVAGVGGLLHVMLPQSSINPEGAQAQPARFVDTGVPELFRAAYRLGAAKERMIVKVAGGASAQSGETDSFQIGKRNWVALRQILWRNGVLVQAQDVGGRVSRTMRIALGTGEVTIRTNGADTVL